MKAKADRLRVPKGIRGPRTAPGSRETGAKTKQARPAALEVSELRYRRLFETAQDGILILDAGTGAITDVNPFLMAMLGYTREEFIDKKLWEVGAFRDIEASKDAFEALQKDKYIRYENLPLKAKDGGLVQVEFVSNVYPAGEESVIQCNIRDITARAHVEQARHAEHELFLKTFHISPVPSVLTKLPERTIVDINPAFEAEFGYERAEAIGRSIAEFGLWADPAEGEQVEQVLLKNRQVRQYEFQFKTKSGNAGYAMFYSAISDQLEGEFVITQIMDVTERHRAEQKVLESEAVFREQSVRDHLTGLFNRRYLEETLERELRRATRGRHSVGVIMLDVDGFKGFNDTRGHAAGDEVLRALGALLIRHVRAEDIPSRFGGDEFILVLPDASRDITSERAALVCELARQLDVRLDGESLQAITLSAGVASFPENGSTAAEVLRAADAALYRAKSQGHGGLVMAE